MKVHLGILQSRQRYLKVNTYISVILYGCNYLYGIYYAFKKESKCSIVIRKEKNTKSDNGKIFALNNVVTWDL